MAHGDWRSDAYLRYIDRSIQDNYHISNVVAKAIHKLQ